MGIRSGRQFLGLRGRQMWIDGELVEDVTRDLRFAAAAAHAMAELYDMQHAPAQAKLAWFLHASRNAVVDRPDDVSRMFVRMCEIIQTLGEIGRGSLLC